MSAAGIIAIGAVLGVLALTLAYQYRPCYQVISRFDVIRLLPRWTFFAPNPATHDCHLIVRDKLADGTTNGWSVVDLNAGRALLDPVWNPAKRVRKVISDAVQALKIILRENRYDAVTSLPYLLILGCCLSRHRIAPNSVARQFSIVETTGRSDRRILILFTSAFHPL
jgi:hypothetical protein